MRDVYVIFFYRYKNQNNFFYHLPVSYQILEKIDESFFILCLFI